MIIGDCPYDCGESHMVPCAPADRCPCFSKEQCEGCGKEFWIRHSRVDPEAYTLEDFAAKFSVDEETKELKARG